MVGSLPAFFFEVEPAQEGFVVAEEPERIRAEAVELTPAGRFDGQVAQAKGVDEGTAAQSTLTGRTGLPRPRPSRVAWRRKPMTPHESP